MPWSFIYCCFLKTEKNSKFQSPKCKRALFYSEMFFRKCLSRSSYLDSSPTALGSRRTFFHSRTDDFPLKIFWSEPSLSFQPDILTRFQTSLFFLLFSPLRQIKFYSHIIILWLDFRRACLAELYREFHLLYLCDSEEWQQPERGHYPPEWKTWIIRSLDIISRRSWH